MWTVLVTVGATEFLVRDRLVALGLQVFCPYTVEKQRVKAPTRGRTVFKAVDTEIPRWPRYLFCRTEDDAALALVKATRDVNYLLKSAEGEPALLPDNVMAKIMAGCDTSGKVLSRALLHDFSAGDLLRFVAGSSFANRSALVIGIEQNGAVRVMVDSHIKAIVDFKDLAA